MYPDTPPWLERQVKATPTRRPQSHRQRYETSSEARQVEVDRHEKGCKGLKTNPRPTGQSLTHNQGH